MAIYITPPFPSGVEPLLTASSLSKLLIFWFPNRAARSQAQRWGPEGYGWAVPCCRLERVSPEVTLGKPGEEEEQGWVNYRVPAAVKGPKFLEVLLGFLARGTPSISLGGYGFRGWLGRVGQEPGVLSWDGIPPGLTSPLRACAFTQPSFYRNPHHLSTHCTQLLQGAQHISQVGCGMESAHSMITPPAHLQVPKST